MKNELLNQYRMLVNFLGKTLGPSFEIVLHEIKGEEVKMIAIANGEISNRTLENSISTETLHILKNKSYHNEESMVNHTVLLKNGKKVRSSSMFIKENQKIIGMLCINFDDSKFHDINCQILRIIHPDMFVKNYLSDVSYNILMDENKSQSDEENSTDNLEAFMEKIFQEVNLKFNYPLERLTKQERVEIVKALYEKGLFNLKDAINFVAQKLSCSPTTIYRYVGKIEKKQKVWVVYLPTLSLYIKGVMKSKFNYTSLKTIWSLSKSIKTLDFSWTSFARIFLARLVSISFCIYLLKGLAP